MGRDRHPSATKGVPGTEVILPDAIDDDGHTIWPWNCTLMYCPSDRRFHRFGCDCARQEPRLIPASIRDLYRQSWPGNEATDEN